MIGLGDLPGGSIIEQRDTTCRPTALSLLAGVTPRAAARHFDGLPMTAWLV